MNTVKTIYICIYMCFSLNNQTQPKDFNINIHIYHITMDDINNKTYNRPKIDKVTRTKEKFQKVI